MLRMVDSGQQSERAMTVTTELMEAKFRSLTVKLSRKPGSMVGKLRPLLDGKSSKAPVPWCACIGEFPVNFTSMHPASLWTVSLISPVLRQVPVSFLSCCYNKMSEQKQLEGGVVGCILEYRSGAQCQGVERQLMAFLHSKEAERNSSTQPHFSFLFTPGSQLMG